MFRITQLISHLATLEELPLRELPVTHVREVVDSRECDNTLNLNTFDHSFRTVVQRSVTDKLQRTRHELAEGSLGKETFENIVVGGLLNSVLCDISPRLYQCFR